MHFLSGSLKCLSSQQVVNIPVILKDYFSYVKTLEIDVAIPATPIPVIPIQTVVPSAKDKLSIGVCEPIIKRVIKPPPEGTENIIDILDADHNITESRLDCLKSFFSLNNDEVESTPKSHAPSLVPYLQCLLRALQGGSYIFNAYAVIKEAIKKLHRCLVKPYLTKCPTLILIDFLLLKPLCIILQRDIGITPLKSKVEWLIKQAYDLRDLDQMNDLSSQVDVSEHFLQEAKKEVIDLQT
ncbi:hypothetical protein Cgig2_002943 [Carnegiea gigantea]|uniref:Uncharacterized protein n=1 Tax=Carnegiea gigantea TaxID=171969 RepID=A0A9Q1JN92_9CARY|nr:hypothetical protein Cgig2_002943 [Carnegiea gigantea]